MFTEIFRHTSFYLWLGIPLIATVLLARLIDRSWGKNLKDGKVFTFKAETLRNPMNTAIAVSGLVIPLVCTCLAYLAAQGTRPGNLAALIASLVLLSASVLVGLYNLFSMTECHGDDVITIKADSFRFFIPAFVIQLLLLLDGVAVLVSYFIFSFSLVAPSGASIDNPGVLIARPPLRVGMTVERMTQLWGEPERTDNRTNFYYSSSDSQFTVAVSNGLIWSVTERKR